MSHPAKTKAWANKCERLFVLNDVTPAQRTFLDSSVVEVETIEKEGLARLKFRGGFEGKCFRVDHSHLTFEIVCKGAFVEDGPKIKLRTA